MRTIRERLAVLAAHLGIQLPEEYVAFMEAPPARGIPVRHLCAAGDPPAAWWPEPIEYLEADIHRGRMPTPVLGAHYLRATPPSTWPSGGGRSPAPAGRRSGSSGWAGGSGSARWAGTACFWMPRRSACSRTWSTATKPE